MFDGWFGGKKSEPARQLVAPTLGPISNDIGYSSDAVRMGQIFGYDTQTDAGASVTPVTAMRLSVVYACVQRIAGAIAGLPLPIFERVDEQDRKRTKHDYWWLLNERPCSNFSAATFWEFITSQMLLRGDGIAYLVRNRAGSVTNIIPWPRSQVEIERFVSDDPKVPDRLRYYFYDYGGGDQKGTKRYFGADQDDVLHFPGFGFNGVYSMSAIQWGARNGIGIALKGDQYAARFYASGGRPALAIKAPGEFTPTQQEAFRTAWINKYAASPGVENIPFFLTEGLDIKELTLSAVDAQLLESRQWQVVDICRAFGVPPFMVGEMGKATYNNTENLGVDFVKYTLNPHLNRFEQELNIKLFRTPQYFVEFNTDGLMRGDSKARAEYYKAALGGTQNPGWMTQNEVRKTDNLPPIDGGDDLHAPDPNAPAAPAEPKTPPADEPAGDKTEGT